MGDKVYGIVVVNEELSSRVRRLIAGRDPSFYDWRTVSFLFHSRYDWVLQNYYWRISWEEIMLLRELLRRVIKANPGKMNFDEWDSKILELASLSVGECKLKEGVLFGVDTEFCFQSDKIYEYEYKVICNGGRVYQVFLSPDLYVSFSPSEFDNNFEFYDA